MTNGALTHRQRVKAWLRDNHSRLSVRPFSKEAEVSNFLDTVYPPRSAMAINLRRHGMMDFLLNTIRDDMTEMLGEDGPFKTPDGLRIYLPVLHREEQVGNFRTVRYWASRDVFEPDWHDRYRRTLKRNARRLLDTEKKEAAWAVGHVFTANGTWQLADDAERLSA